MKTVRLVCPNCSSPDFEPMPLDQNRCRCKHCGAYFAISEAKSEGAARGGSGPRRAGAGVAGLAFVITLCALLAGTGALVFLRTRPPRRSSYTYEPVKVKPLDVQSTPVEPE